MSPKFVIFIFADVLSMFSCDRCQLRESRITNKSFDLSWPSCICPWQFGTQFLVGALWWEPRQARWMLPSLVHWGGGISSGREISKQNTRCWEFYYFSSFFGGQIIPKWLVQDCWHFPILFWSFLELWRLSSNLAPCPPPYLSQKHFKEYKKNDKSFWTKMMSAPLNIL